MTTEAAERLLAELDRASAEIVPEPTDDELLTGEFLQSARGENPYRFRITDRNQLAWAMRRVAGLEDETDQVNEAADAQIHRVNTWRQQEQARIARRKAYFEALVAAYLDQERKANPKLKSISTPDGRAGFRKQQPEWKITSAEDLVATLKATGRTDLVKVEEAPRLGELKKDSHVELRQVGTDPITELPVYQLWIRTVNPETGEVTSEGWLPGVVVTERPDKPYIDTEGA